MDQNVLVIAFDGLDKELIERFELENITQEEFGGIDNRTGIDTVSTSELFTSFITGVNHEEHGVTGLAFYLNDREEVIEKFISDDLAYEYRGFQRLRKTLKVIFGADDGMKRYRNEDWEYETLFRKIETSRGMFVPAYSTSVFFGSKMGTNPIQHGYSSEDALEIWDTREHTHRVNSLFNEMERIGSRPFLMCHFHRPDKHQHHYGDRSIEYDERKLKKLYRETDELAEDIKEKALAAGYDYVIFMSDHGLPTDEAHNENAFYSCNKELFGKKTPHITDFHDKILELAENEDELE